MRYLSFFSGVEMAHLAVERHGWELVACAEIDPFASAVIAERLPHVPNLGDVSKITPEQIEALGPLDAIIMGFPCQDVSIAGKRKGLRNDDGSVTRSGLFYDAMRLVRAADPRWLILENVPATDPRIGQVIQATSKRGQACLTGSTQTTRRGRG